MILDTLDRLGIEYKKEAGERAKICCPFHDEKTPSMTIYDNNSCYCFGCQKRCWHDELIAKLTNCSIIEAKKKLGIFDPNAQYVCSDQSGEGKKIVNYDFADPIRDFSGSFEKLPTDVPDQMLEFLKSKALDQCALTLGKWRWHPRGTFKCWERQEGIAIPYFGPNGEISTFRLRRYDRMRQKFEHPLAPKGVPLQASYLIHDKSKPFYFCEGESDSLSMFSIGRNVICLPGVGAHRQLNSAIMNCLQWNVPKLVFCGDNDEAGREFNNYATKAALTLGLGIFVPQIRTLKLPDEYNALKDGSFKRKDINDFLIEGRLEQIISDFEAKDANGRSSFKQTEEPKQVVPQPNALDNLRLIFGDYEEMDSPETKGVF